MLLDNSEILLNDHHGICTAVDLGRKEYDIGRLRSEQPLYSSGIHHDVLRARQ